MFRTLSCLRKARVSIPRLSPTHTKARIYKWLAKEGDYLECYDPIFILECSPDVVSEGYRVADDHQPLMIVEAHDEGTLSLKDGVLDTTKWHSPGHELGAIDDGTDDNEEDDWLWQGYAHSEE